MTHRVGFSSHNQHKQTGERESHVFHPVSFEVKSDTEIRTVFKVFFVLIRSRGRGRL